MSHKVTLSLALQDQLDEQTCDWMRKVALGEAPPYPDFVGALFNAMDTPTEALLHATSALNGEGGELFDCAKKPWAYRDRKEWENLDTLDFANLLEELGDVRFYYQAVLNLFGLTDDDIMAENHKKLAKRYASGAFTHQQAHARADKA